MGEVSTYPDGHFCWVDLGTTDVDGSKAFYGGLFGWELQDIAAGGDQTYTRCRLNGFEVAGLHAHAEAEGSGWSSSIAVDDVDATTLRAREVGASVVLEPQEIPGTARLSVIRDLVGAEVSLWQAKGFAGARLVNEPGAWTWNELVTAELDRATGFYRGLFGWESGGAPAPIPRVGFTKGGYLIGGAHAPQPGEDDSPRWTVAFGVEDADASATRAQELGGRVLLPAMDIPTGRFAVVADPAGASFTISAVPGGGVRGLDGS
ncbi:MAG: VOC family protein [Actinomycetota bacterium]